MREVPVTVDAAAARTVGDLPTSVLRTLRTLADVLAWGRAQVPPRSVTEIVTQDEYTHDVVLALDGRVYLVFDTT